MKLEEIFKEKKPIIGMIHLAGETANEKISRAFNELRIYEQQNIDGAIIEDYHGEAKDVLELMKKTSNRFNKLVIGVNLLSNPYLSFVLANAYGAKFVQFDSVQTSNLDLESYSRMRAQYSDIVVLGGVGFKYIPPTGNSLEIDLREGKSRCEAIVTTGKGTGIETPLDKLREYKKLLGKFPLIVGAGVNLNNLAEQMKVADGAIIGSYFKLNENTKADIDENKVKNIMQQIKLIRKTYS